MFPQFDPAAERTLLAKGMAASPGAAVGRGGVRLGDRARRGPTAGEDVILVRRETNPDDLEGMIAAAGVLTARGGKTSHAAVVARGHGHAPASAGPRSSTSTSTPGASRSATWRPARATSSAIDGSTGEVFARRGARRRLAGGDLPRGRPRRRARRRRRRDRDLVTAVDRLLTHADAARRLACEPTPTPPRTPPRPTMGAEGIGLCRTEHMFLGERRVLIERLILAETDDEREAALDALLPLQREDFVGLLAAMDGLPVDDPAARPAAARVPARPHRARPSRSRWPRRRATRTPRSERLLAAVERLHESNPMLGLRGVRLGLVVPGLFAMQVRAIAEAAAERDRGGRRPAGGDHGAARGLGDGAAPGRATRPTPIVRRRRGGRASSWTSRSAP